MTGRKERDMRLIDADEYDKKLQSIYTQNADVITFFIDGIVEAIELLEEQPTIDAVPVIRCKDCKWFRAPDKKHFHSWCRWEAASRKRNCEKLVHEDEFCSWAERKEKEKQ